MSFKVEQTLGSHVISTTLTSYRKMLFYQSHMQGNFNVYSEAC